LQDLPRQVARCPQIHIHLNARLLSVLACQVSQYKLQVAGSSDFDVNRALCLGRPRGEPRGRQDRQQPKAPKGLETRPHSATHNVMLLLHSLKEVFSLANRHNTSGLPKIEARWLQRCDSRFYTRFSKRPKTSVSQPNSRFFKVPVQRF
jgi:hypothetical protein